MAKKENTALTVRSIAEPLAKELGLKIWDVRYLKEGTQWYLRVFIDKDGGVGIDDCVEMSHALDKPLEEADLIAQSYTLEVCSPGIERELTRPEHFEGFIGSKVTVKLIRPIDGKRDFKGVLESYDNGAVVLRAEDGSGISFEKKEASWIKLDDFNEE